jgi:tetratricopeptide (TPR) repeat protein
MAEKLKDMADEMIDEDELIDEEEFDGSGDQDRGAQTFLQKYSKWIIAGLAVIVLGAGFLFYRSYKNAGNSAIAEKEMIHAQVAYEKVMSGQAPDSLLYSVINGGPSPTGGVFKGFLKIAADYGNTTAGNLAHYYLGTSYLRLGQIDKGIASLEAFSKDDNMVSAMAYNALGAAYEEKANWDKAAENYEAAASTMGENTKSTPLFLMSLARVYETANKKDQALDTYKKIKQQYPLSEEGLVVDKYIGRITAGKTE